MNEFEAATIAYQHALLTITYWQTGLSALTLFVSSGLVLYGFRLMRLGTEQRREEARQQHEQRREETRQQYEQRREEARQQHEQRREEARQQHEEAMTALKALIGGMETVIARTAKDSS